MPGEGLSLRQALVVQGVVAVLAVSGGAFLGWIAGRQALEQEQVERLGMSADDLLARLQGVEKQYTDLYAQCDPLEGSERDRLIEAQERVETLRGEIEQREAEIQALEVKAKENVALKREVEAKKRELATLRSELQAAEQERAELVERLELAVAEVSVAREETRQARHETLSVRWDDFRARAALEVCEKGTRAKLERCREEVLAALTPDLERRYRECVRRGGAVPQLRELGKNEQLPDHSEYLNPSSRLTRGWYVLFCDPTLPEAGEDATAREAVGESDPANATGRKDAFLEALGEEAGTP